MIDETTGPGEQGAPEGQSGVGERVAFCQQCGTGLTATTVRRVGAAVYCEPCLVARLEGSGATTGTATGSAAAGTSTAASGWAPVSGAVPPPGAAGQPAGIPTPNEPSPWLAALLGLIPGVGAMYNGQYAKGVAHLVIFAVLDSLAHNVNDIFGLLVVGWIFYQAFDAYHTAAARRDGTPLPNPFGLNDIGDRMGFGRNWPGSAARPATSSTTAGWATAPGSAAATTAAASSAGPNWAGYVPPTNFGASATPPPPVPPVQPVEYAATPGVDQAIPPASPPSTPWADTPYGTNYAAEPWRGAGVPPLQPIPMPVRRFPVGAAWLIGLGLIFLLANLNAEWRLSAAWITAIVLGALGSWLLYRRVEMVSAWAKAAGEADPADAGIAPRLVCQIRWPVMLLVLALLFALQAAGVRTLGQTWGVLLIALGALLVLERMVGRTRWYPMHMPTNPAVPGPTTAARKDGQ